jgi:hypothetical protein
MRPETAKPLKPVSHVFVDFENVHDVDLTIVGAKNVRLTILIGSRQTKLEVGLVEKLLQHSGDVELIRLKSSGANALDFTLAYYLGRAVLADPTGHFHIISKDTGFDPLIQHLGSRNIRVQRHSDYSTLAESKSIPEPTLLVDSASLLSAVGGSAPLTTSALATSRKPRSPAKPKEKARSLAAVVEAVTDEREQRVLAHFRKPTTTRPRTKTRLVSFLIAYFARKLSEAEVLSVIENLMRAGHLAIDEKQKVTYNLGTN